MHRSLCIKIAILPKLTYRINAIPNKIQISFLKKTAEFILKFIQKGKGHRLAKPILEKKKKVGRLKVPDFKTYYKVTTKTVYYWHKYRHIDQWNIAKSTEIDPYLYGQLIFAKINF